MAHQDDIMETEEDEEIEGGEAFGAELEAVPEEPLGGEMLGEEEALPEEGAAASLEEGVSQLIMEWQPTTPEGEQYKAELEGMMSQFAGELGGEEEMLPEEAGMPPEGGIPAGDLAGMRNEAASRAFRGMP